MFTIYKKEVFGYFNSLIGYVAIALFLLITGLIVWVFPESSVVETGYASLDVFFNLAPYLLIGLIPALLMRSIAGEKADGTYDLLLSRPLRISQIVLGKFFGGLTIVILAILPTLIYVLSIYVLAFPSGDIDLGAMIGSYLGLILVGSSFVAIALFCSSLTNNPIVAFLLAVFVNFFIFYAIGATSKILSFGEFEDVIKNFGAEQHYLAISRGVLLGNDLFYFLSIIFVFLVFSIGHLDRFFIRRSRKFTGYAFMLIVVIAINQEYLSLSFMRVDFTEDKRFTLDKTSKDIVSVLDEDIYITLFLNGALPSGFTRLKQAAINMAYDLGSYAKGKIKINIIDPTEGTEAEQKDFSTALINRGLYPTNLNVKRADGYTQKLIFPYVIINRGDDEVNVNLLQNRAGQTPDQILNNSIANLEYAFVSAIAKIVSGKSSFIGFTEGHGEPSDLALYDAMQTLGSANQVGRLNLDAIEMADLGNIDLMIIAKPKTMFSESDKYKIDYFIRQGGAVIWAIDQVDASLDNIRQTSSQPLIGHRLNLDDQLFLYGVRLNYDVVADLNCAQIPLSMGNIGGQRLIELAPWYFFPILMPNSSNPVVKNLDGIRTEFIGTLDTLPSKGIAKEILLYSSPYSRIFKSPSTIALQMIEETPDPHKFNGSPSAVAVLLKGKFPAIFENRPIPSGINEATVESPSSIEQAKMIVVADGYWLINQINAKDQSPFPLGWDRYTERQYANKVFLENAVDYLMNDESLISLRNREVKLQLLDQALVKTSKMKWQIINVVFPIVLLLVAGFVQYYMRKRKYGTA